MHAFSYGVVLLAVVHQLAQLGLQQPVLFAQADNLPFINRNGASAVRMRYGDAADHVRESFEKLRMVLQITGNVFRFHSVFSTSISPSNTDCAGPVITTGCASRGHAICSMPPRVSTCTGESSIPSEMPATAAAQAPVPQESVSPAPRSNTRSLMCPRSMICIYPALVRCAKRGWCSIDGPSLNTGAASTSATSCTACGLPIDTAKMSMLRPLTSSGYVCAWRSALNGIKEG